MLSIRMQRTGRKGHAMFRVVVQDARLTPTSGKVVALLGSYDPHAKVATLDKEKATFYLGNGAQPSDRAARLLQSEGIKLPSWVSLSGNKTGKLRNPEKLRKNQPKDNTQPEKLAEETATTEEAGVTAEAEA
jgi:small subunit ribosomal protein S16